MRIYLPKGGTTEIDLGGIPAEFSVEWYNPRTGGALQHGSLAKIASPGWQSIGHPPAEVAQDWVALVKLVGVKSLKP